MENEEKEFDDVTASVDTKDDETKDLTTNTNTEKNDGENSQGNEEENGEEEKSLKSRVIAEIVSWLKVIVIAAVLAVALNKFILFNFTVPSESMENTIMVDNKIMSLRCAYWFSDPKRGDIIVFPFPDDPTETYIKRIIGMPKDKIEGKDGIVYINDQPLDEPYVKSDLDEPFGPYVVPNDSYFVMGDNRDESADARYWDHKFVKKEDIISKAVLRFSPGFKLLK